MDVVLRLIFAVAVRPLGMLLRRRDVLRLRRPESTNWRSAP
ncbi:MAG TPA: hypothetical protein VFA66_11940 [Gaiellaceae bacterium]|nr:hypothetical protein [Gaiellaceae bacterium]